MECIRAIASRAGRRGNVNRRIQESPYRLIFVWSEAKTRQEAKTRERHVSKIREEFAAAERNLNKYSLTTQEKVLGRLELAKAKYTVGSLFEYQLTNDRKGLLHLTWKINAHQLQRLKQLEGVYVLKTNLLVKRCPTAKALSTYKGQSQVERRFHHCKGPLAVAPMFLEKPERMAGLLCILIWALMVLALMERQTRRSLKGQPMYGLYPENRPSLVGRPPHMVECRHCRKHGTGGSVRWLATNVRSVDTCTTRIRKGCDGTPFRPRLGLSRLWCQPIPLQSPGRHPDSPGSVGEEAPGRGR